MSIDDELNKQCKGLTRREIIDRQIDIVEQMEQLSKRLDRVQSTYDEQHRKMRNYFEQAQRKTVTNPLRFV